MFICAKRASTDDVCESILTLTLMSSLFVMNVEGVIGVVTRRADGEGKCERDPCAE